LEDTAGKLGINKKQIQLLNSQRDERRDGESGHLSKKEAGLQRKASATERSMIMELHNAGLISVLVLRFIELDLDLQEMRLDQSLHPNGPV